ncbi:MAG: TIGR03768 family metallophosphoesterase [Syntrophus sp. (in: bacteria)]|nr:TIGR03768 family metallophosphoesterase [Syntrophus sp. (in: bacteria)]
MKEHKGLVKSVVLLALILCGGLTIISSGGGSDTAIQGQGYPVYPISSTVVTTADRTIAYSAAPTPPDVSPQDLSKVWLYNQFNVYGNTSTSGPALVSDQRIDPAPVGIMPAGFTVPASPPKAKLLNFFAMTDVHITDKESPAQLIYLQQLYYPIPPVPGLGNYPWTFVTSVYSPIMPYTTHVLDAAIQTVNALHKQPGKSFDFGISLGDVANSTQYNELRWYIDVIDGQVITPSSGANLGSSTVDYQMPYKAAGLDKTIPLYQTLGNHDHFFIGSLPVNAFLRQAYISDTVFATGDVLLNTLNVNNPLYYMGVLDGATSDSTIIHAGPVADFYNPPKVAADQNRYSLLRTQWISEFFNTTSNPVGHGFNLVDPGAPSGFACYSFVPKAGIPVKVIVLDNTQSENDGDTGIHGHGYLDPVRWAWLKKELADGDAANQLMIIAAHIPIGVSPLNSNLEWWDNSANPSGTQNAVTLKELITELQIHPNLLMWIAGHRHVNAIKAFYSSDPAHPENGFWQIETSSLRDHPQNFRTFEIYVNSDYTISIVATNVDPAVGDGTPAAKSRHYAVAAQQIVGSPASLIYQNPSQLIDINNQLVIGTPDPSIKPMLTNGSYNATLYKQLSPAMKARMQALFP